MKVGLNGLRDKDLRAGRAIFRIGPELDRVSRLVLACIASFADRRSGRAYPSLETLAYFTSLSERSVSQANAYLEREKHVIRVIRSSAHRSNQYDLNVLERMAEESVERFSARVANGRSQGRNLTLAGRGDFRQTGIYRSGKTERLSMMLWKMVERAAVASALGCRSRGRCSRGDNRWRTWRRTRRRIGLRTRDSAEGSLPRYPPEHRV